MDKPKRHNLSGIYFRAQNAHGKWENVCFEELTETQQDERMSGQSEAFLKNLVKLLAAVLKEVGDKFEIYVGDKFEIYKE